MGIFVGEYEITIINWDQHQPRTDMVRHPFWFKIKNDMPQDEALFDKSLAIKWTWICLLCTASQKRSQKFKVKKKWLVQFSGIAESELDAAILDLQVTGMIESAQSIVHTYAHTSVQPTVTRIEKNREEKNRGEEEESLKNEIPKSETGIIPKSETEEKTATTEATDLKNCLWGEPMIKDFLKDVPITMQEIWVKAFTGKTHDKFWLEAEIKKAAAWWSSNPGKRIYGDTIPRFVNGWLTRASKEPSIPIVPLDENKTYTKRQRRVIPIGKTESGATIYGEASETTQ